MGEWGVCLKARTMDKITNDIEKKKYTKHTILTGNSKRIEEVLKRFWSLKSAAVLKNSDPKSDIIDYAKEIFE